MLYEKDAISFDEPVGEMDQGKQKTLKDFIPDNSISLEEKIDKISLKDTMKEVLLELDNELEINVIKMRFGLDGNDPKTIRTIAKECNLMPEKIQQIENKALRKLRTPKNSSKLREYIK